MNFYYRCSRDVHTAGAICIARHSGVSSRLHEDQIKSGSNRTGEICRTPDQLLVSSGLMVGQFINFGQGVSLSPLALAFLAGYAVDVYFAFLEGLLQMFTRVGNR